MTGNTVPRSSLLGRGSRPETSRIAQILRKETVGGALLLVATVLALGWANSPWSQAYLSLRRYTIGPAALHLDLTLSEWAGDGLLAIFFFVAGLELKREFVAGDLRDPRRAAVPIAAAIGGVLTPAVVYTVINLGNDAQAGTGWAIPTATDIAFALAVLAVIGTHLPAALRTFLLTVAVVDDLLAITIIAIFYTSDLSVLPLTLMLLPLAAFTFCVQRRIRSWWILLPLALATWVLLHASGVHATVAGVLLGFAVPVVQGQRSDSDTGPGLAEQFEHAWRPLSAAVAVPIFAFMSAGVTIGGLSGLGSALQDRVAIGVVAGLVVGKAAGMFGATYLIARFTKAQLDEGLAWIDVFGLAILAGIGFTVSLLIGELAFGEGTARDDHVKVAVLAGSLLAALFAAVVLRIRNRVYRNLCAAEELESDRDDVPDIDQHPGRARQNE